MAVLDEYSRFAEVEVLKSVSAETVIPILDKILASRGTPDKIKTDNGPPFQSAEFADFAQQLGFVHQKVTPYWPEANGQAESFMKCLGKTVKCAQLEGKPWRRELHRFLRNYRATPHSSTGVPPASALNGYSMKIKLPELRNRPQTHIQEFMQKDMINNDSKSKMKMKHYAERRRNIKQSNLKVGDSVLMKNATKRGKLTSKFHEQPFEVIERKGDMVIARRGQEIKARNTSHFKSIRTEEKPLYAEPEPELEHAIETPPAPLSPSISKEQDTPTREKPYAGDTSRVLERDPAPRVRPRRQSQMPNRYKDFVMN